MINRIDNSSNYVYTKQKKIELSDIGEKFNLDYKNGEMSSEAKDKKELPGQEKEQSVERGGVRLELSVGTQTAGADRQAQRESAQIPLLEAVRSYIATAIAAVQEFFRKIWNDQPAGEAAQETVDSGEIMTTGEIIAASEIISADEIAAAGETVATNEIIAIGGIAAADGVTAAGEIIAIDGNTAISENIAAGENIATGRIISTDEMADISGREAAPTAEMDPDHLDREIQQSLRDGDVNQAINLLTDNGRRTVAKNSTLLTSYDKNGRVVEPSASVRERALHGDRNTWKL